MSEIPEETPNNSRYQSLPEVLVKSAVDAFDYALGLRNGQVIRFESATFSLDGTWVHLKTDDTLHPMIGVDYTFDRGIDVRISDIVWVADAPEGS